MAGEKILLVDTEQNVLHTYRTVLQEEGFSVETSTIAADALEKITRDSVSVLITELYLKGQNTLGLIREIKTDHPDIYIIMITAASCSPEDYGKIIDSGVDDYFTKPFSAQSLLANIRKGLQRRQLLLKNRELERKIKGMENQTYDQPVSEQNRTIYSATYFNTILQHEMVRAKRYNHSFSLIMLDTMPKADSTKDYAQASKAEIAHELSEILLKHTRKTDIVTVYNGTLALILVETSKDGTAIFQNRLEKELAGIFSKNSHADTQQCENISIDCLTFPEQSQSIEQWIQGSKNHCRH